jgi:hypothetical protein
MSRKQSLKTALKSPEILHALGYLIGCPVGSWGETTQAWERLRAALPARDARSYTAEELVTAGLQVDHAGRYARR